MSIFRTLRQWLTPNAPAHGFTLATEGGGRASTTQRRAFEAPLPRLDSPIALQRVLDGPLSDAEAMQALHKSPGFLAILDADNRVVWSAGLGIVPRPRSITDELTYVQRTLGPIEFQTVIDHVTHNVMAYPWFDQERRRHTVLHGTPWFPAAKATEVDDARVASIAAYACEAAALLGESPTGLCAACERRGVCWLHDRHEAATTTG